MIDQKAINIVKTMVITGLTLIERKVLIIELMNADNYTVDDVFAVINDVVYLQDFPKLAERLQK